MLVGQGRWQALLCHGRAGYLRASRFTWLCLCYIIWPLKTMTPTWERCASPMTKQMQRAGRVAQRV